MMVLALLPALAFIAKNAILFHFPFVATGAGNALYLGNNPLTGGYDPAYLGLGFDVGSIARDQSHLTLEAERLLRGAAGIVMASRDIGDQLALHLHKLGAFLFITNAEIEGPVALLRAWRIGLFVLAALGAWALRRQLLGWVIVATLGYQVAVHVPVLFTLRYSVGTIDPWLVLLAGIGLATFVDDRRRTRIAAVGAAMMLALAAGVAVQRYAGMPEPDVLAAARVRVWEGTPQQVAVGASGAEIEIREAPRFHPWANHVLLLQASVQGGSRRCEWFRISFRPLGDSSFAGGHSRCIPRGHVARYQLGGVPLRLNSPGTLRIEAVAGGGPVLDIRRIAVYSPRGGAAYRAQLLGEPPPPELEPR